MGLEEALELVKRHCLLCSTYKTFRPADSDEYKARVLSELKNIAKFYNEEFAELRKKDAEVEDIQKARANKTVCLDAVTVCQKCDKEIDSVRRFLQNLK